MAEELARSIARRHPDIKGFTRASLFRMRQLFDTYWREPKVAPLVRQLPWTHNLLILSKCKRAEEREFYLRLAVREKCAKRELERQLNGALFERAVLAPPKVSPLVTQLHPAAGRVFQDSYLLDSLDLPVGQSEGDLQRGLTGDSKRFLIELGRDFAFVGEQYVLQVGGRNFRLDQSRAVRMRASFLSDRRIPHLREAERLEILHAGDAEFGDSEGPEGAGDVDAATACGAAGGLARTAGLRSRRVHSVSTNSQWATSSRLALRLPAKH